MLTEGSTVTGKWTGLSLSIERHLGTGANGQVYLVQSARGRGAMKVCNKSTDIAMEWGLLEKLSKGNRVFPKPMFIDDDPPDVFFYVMEWVPGQPFHEAAKRMSAQLFHASVAELLTGLSELHSLGYGFCDLKPENILVSIGHDKVSVRFVDVGGVTAFNRSVRQYTPFYDRAFWGLGSRRADPAYDLCAVALLILFAHARPSDTLFGKSPEQRQDWLWKMLKRHPVAAYRPVLGKVLRGDMLTAMQCKDEWERAYRNAATAARGAVFSPSPGKPASGRSSVTVQTPVRRVGRSRRRTDWTEWLMWTSLCTAAMVTFTAWASFLGWF